MNESLQDLVRQATLLTQSGRLHEATQTIQRALRGTMTTAAAPQDASVILDGCVVEVDTPRPPTRAESGPGEFTRGSHTHAGLTRSFKLYTPPGRAGQALPLVVMLHGCTQDADDFAMGTDMNERAREQGFYVLYPEQAQDANPGSCWNWFKHNHQARGRGEPALLANLTQALVQQHGMDARRVFVAGMSAGGAMATIMATEYPDIFAAVGVHSGLPTGSASNMSEALMVMSSGEAGIAMPAMAQPPGVKSKGSRQALVVIPTIVFHGDQDHTVHPRNGEKVIETALGNASAPGTARQGAARMEVEQGQSAQGRPYTRSIHRDAKGRTLTEHWLVHGTGHAWSGGNARGSYTDARGPDATGEMLRFFFEQVR